MKFFVQSSYHLSEQGSPESLRQTASIFVSMQENIYCIFDVRRNHAYGLDLYSL
jgi:hypothetical protein